MKDILIILVNILIALTNQQILQLNSYSSQSIPLYTGSLTNLLNIVVECPNSGIIKNFCLKTNKKYIWYNFQCYSSIKKEADEGEAIIKQIALTDRKHAKVYFNAQNINALNNFNVSCWSDYGINSFKLFMESSSSSFLYMETKCHGLKSSYTTPINVETKRALCEKSNPLNSTYSCLFDIVVGSTATENNVDIGFPLRGFRYIIEDSQTYPTVYYLYSYAKLRNMKVIKDLYEQKFKQQLENNDQKD